MKSIFLFLALFVLFSCEKEDTIYFKTTALRISNADNSGQIPVDAGTSVAARAYAIKMGFTNEIVSGPVTTENIPFQHAVSLLSFDVYALQNFDSLHPAHRSLNEYFLLSRGTVSSYCTILACGEMIGTSFERNVSSWNFDQYLVLMKPPDTLGTYNFVIDISYGDGHHLRDTTNVNLF